MGPTLGPFGARIDSGATVLLTDLLVNASGAHAAIAAGPGNDFLVVGEGVRNGASRVFGHLVSFASTPIMQSLTLADDGATIAWSAEPGKSYRVQFKPDLSNTNWLELDPLVTATNNSASILDRMIGRDSQRFYRVLQLPQPERFRIRDANSANEHELAGRLTQG